jgi:sulfotransferase
MSKTLESKTFYFMGGLPRSGSTVLTAILNQHPKIYASPQSNLINMCYTLENEICQSESWLSGLQHEDYENTLNNLGNLFYSNVKKPIIIDKNRAWGTPGNNFIAKRLSDNPKTIIVLRPILEVLSSFIRLAEKNPDNFIDRIIKNEDFYVKFYRDTNDVRCDYLMRANGEIDQALLAIATLIKNPESYHIIWYDNLIANPQKCLTDIYDFLEIDNFQHNFKTIKQLDKHKDEILFGIKDLHKISSTIKASKTKPELVLSNYIINKYSNTLDFIPR